MTARAYVIVLLGAVVALAMIVRQLRRRRLGAKYALVWMGFGVVLLLLAAIPNALDNLARLAGVDYPPALLLVLGLGYFAALCLHFSAELTRLEERTRVLAEELALVRERTTRGGPDSWPSDPAAAASFMLDGPAPDAGLDAARTSHVSSPGRRALEEPRDR